MHCGLRKYVDPIAGLPSNKILYLKLGTRKRKSTRFSLKGAQAAQPTALKVTPKKNQKNKRKHCSKAEGTRGNIWRHFSSLLSTLSLSLSLSYPYTLASCNLQLHSSFHQWLQLPPSLFNLLQSPTSDPNRIPNPPPQLPHSPRNPYLHADPRANVPSFYRLRR